MRPDPTTRAGVDRRDHLVADVEDELASATRRYLDYLGRSGRARPRTLAYYARDLARFTSFLRSQSVTAWGQLRRQHLHRWGEALRATGHSESTVARRAAEVGTFLRHLADEGLIEEDLARAPRVGGGRPAGVCQTLSFQQIDRLLALPDSSPLGLRDRAILAVLYATGVRTGVLVDLDLRQVDVPGRQILRWDARGRAVPGFLGDSAIEAVQAYLDRGRPQLAGDPSVKALFVGRGGRRLSVRAVEHIVSNYGARIGLSVTPRELRSACAAHLRQGGASVRAIRRLLGTDRMLGTKSQAPAPAPGATLYSPGEG